MGQHLSEEGVSEVVGVILLLGLTVLAVAIVAVSFLSAPQPDEMPHAAIAAGNTSGRLTLAHEGGDPLRAGEYRIYVDTGNGLVEKTADFSEPENGIWSIGESIDYTGTGAPRRVVVTVISGGSETILSEPAFVKRGTTFSPDPVEPGDTNGGDEPEESFIDFVINESVFVYGTTLLFSGGNVNGPNATVILTGGLTTDDLNRGASINVSEIYIDGDVTLNGGSAGLGSAEKPGNIYVNGNLTLWEGQRHIYGDVYVNGSFRLKDARLHDNVYVNGDLTLGWTPWLADDARIYYTGTLTTPPNYESDSNAASILAKCIPAATVPGFTMPDQGIPPTKPAEWYASRGYVSSGALVDNLKIFAGSYTSEGWRENATNITIIAHSGDITITGLGGSGVTGVFFAPNGKVTFSGGFLEGVVIARDGFFVESGGTRVIFKNIKEYIANPADYPF
jgi:FlaG/FlaF family flagellin (archaellin)